jgi:hypothetical protein
MMRVVSGSTSTPDATIAAQLAELQAQIAAQHVALEAERERRLIVEAERDRLREAYEALKIQVELAHRRLVIAKAERVDTAQLELEFAATLAELDKLAGLDPTSDEPPGDDGAPPTGDRKKKGGGRRVPHKLVGEERVEVTDPIYEGSVERLGTEESSRVMWRRGGMVRVVLARVTYKTKATTTPASSSDHADVEPTDVAVASTAVPTTPDDRASSRSGVSAAAGSSSSPQASAEDASQGTAAKTASVPTRTLVAPLSAVRDRDTSGTIVTAPMPPQILPGSYALPSLLAHIASDKFCDGLPLHRQEDRFARLGAEIHRSTMARWLEELGAIVGVTIVEAMRIEALTTAFCIATDATGVRVQPTPRPDKKRQPCRRAHFFVQIADADHVFFEFTPVENGEVVSKLFRGFSGFVQADAKSVFDVLYRPPDERERATDDAPADLAIRHEVGCWSHARRGSWEAAVATQDVVAREVLARIMRMFQLEQLWNDRSPDERKALRDRHLRVHVVSFFEFVEEQFERVKHQRGLLRSSLGYCVRQKEALMRFLDDGRLQMTNNHSERQLRRVATGRHAWLFVGSDDHGQAAGNLLTLIASARLHKLDPEEYLRDVFRVLPCWPRERYLELAPRYWRQTRARLVHDELECELGWLTIPEPPLSTAVSASIPAELHSSAP